MGTWKHFCCLPSLGAPTDAYLYVSAIQPSLDATGFTSRRAVSPILPYITDSLWPDLCVARLLSLSESYTLRRVSPSLRTPGLFHLPQVARSAIAWSAVAT